MQWSCSRCGEVHDGLPLDWAFDAPAYWDGAGEPDNFLSEDLCVIARPDGSPDFFIRGVLRIPVRDSGEEVVYGVWTTLSRQNFERAIELWDDPRRTEEPPYFGWLANSIAGYPETLSLKTNVQTRSLTQRPTVELEPTDHPLAVEQHGGITTGRVREIAELHLHGGGST